MKHSESYSHSEAGSEGQPAVGGEEHEAVEIVVAVARTERGAQTSVDVEKEPLQNQLIATLGKQCHLVCSIGAFGITGSVLVIVHEISKDKLRFGIKPCKPT